MLLIFSNQWVVTNSVSCLSLLDWMGCERVPGNSSHIDRTRNRHRWIGREYQG
ncbi:unnamed protein product, partial [Phaeothamnion confervicola]